MILLVAYPPAEAARRLRERADWLERVAKMSRRERLEALARRSFPLGSAVEDLRIFLLNGDAKHEGELLACVRDAAHHANRALDLLEALEWDATATALGWAASCTQDGNVAEEAEAYRHFAAEEIHRLRAEADALEGQP